MIATFSCFIHAATESSPVSVCAYCSDKHAGVRWTIHESIDPITQGPFLSAPSDIKIEFECRDPESNNVSSDINARS